jgi:penicillin amidase
MVADTRGNIGSFIVGDVPVREDLQAMTVNGLPPYLIRSGTGGNEWLPVQHPQIGQAIPYEILPQTEMPHVVNPPTGVIVAANNDAVGVTANNNPLGTPRRGGGIYYLGAYGFNPGFRAARIEQLLKAKLAHGKVIAQDMKVIQADVRAMDATFFVPYISQAFTNASRTGVPDQLAALGSNAGVAEAVGRLRAWDYSTPTGIAEGYDAFDKPGQLKTRSSTEIANSVAATLYYMWRGQFTMSVIDSKLDPYGLPKPNDELTMTALRNLFDTFNTNHGVGASGLDFFPLPGVTSAADRRDIYILQAVADTLTALSGPDFAKAFNGSKQQDDYRWGKLHRIVLAHRLGSIFNVPPAGGAFPPPLLDLDGIPTDGGYQTVDVANNEETSLTTYDSDGTIRARNADSFIWAHGPSQRYVGEAIPSGVNGATSLPGGVSGVITSPFYVNLLPGWLVNDTYDQLFGQNEVIQGAVSVTKYVPSL